MTNEKGPCEMDENPLFELYNWIAENYDQSQPHFFRYFGLELVKRAGIRPGQRILDVATGRGAVLSPAARQVGHDGLAVGVDISRGMLAANHLEQEETFEYADEAAWWSTMWSTGLRYQLERIPAEQLPQVQRDVYCRLAEFRLGDCIAIPIHMLYGFGIRPG
jgi:SAM-dependent methyltransferase